MENLKSCVLLLAYSRPNFAKRRIMEILPQLDNADLQLYVSIDGPISELFDEIVSQFNGHKRIRFIEYNTNLGGAEHYFQSVSRLFNIYDSIIVVEDDVVVGYNAILNLIQAYERVVAISNKALVISGFSAFPTRVSKFVGNWVNEIWYPAKYFNCWGHLLNQEAFVSIVKTKALIENSQIDERAFLKHYWKVSTRHQKEIWMLRAARGTYDYLIQLAIFTQQINHYKPIIRRFDNEGIGDTRATHTKGRRNLLWGKVATTPKLDVQLYGSDFRGFWLHFLNLLDNLLMAQDSWLNVRGRRRGVRGVLFKNQN